MIGSKDPIPEDAIKKVREYECLLSAAHFQRLEKRYESIIDKSMGGNAAQKRKEADLLRRLSKNTKTTEIKGSKFDLDDEDWEF